MSLFTRVHDLVAHVAVSEFISMSAKIPCCFLLRYYITWPRAWRRCYSNLKVPGEKYCLLNRVMPRGHAHA